MPKSLAGNNLLRHGHCVNRTRTKFAETWSQMKARCNNANSISFKYYGARGVKVCDRWRDSFEAFLADVTPCPGPDFTLDRIDPDGDYEPSNCRWATASQQQHNRRDAKLSSARVIEIRRLVQAGSTQASVAARFGIHQCTVSRIANGERWAAEEVSHAPTSRT